MHLKKGACFLCPNNKVVRQSENQEIYKIIALLLSIDLSNATEFGRIQASLRFCPICYHKLIIANRTNKNIQANSSNAAGKSSCLLCNSKENLFEINRWPGFKKITEDLTVSKDSCVTCSDCLYYLEIKNEIKTKLFSKYPKLKVENKSPDENGKKLKSKFVPKIKLKSVPLFGKNKRKSSRKRKFSEIVNNADNSLTDVNINFDKIKKLKPLKDHKVFSKHEFVKSDSKFLNQVPYVLVNVWNSSSDSLNSTADKDKKLESNDTEFLIDLTLDEDIVSSATESNDVNSEEELVKLRNEFRDNRIKKLLVVNVSRINLEKYLEKQDSEAIIQHVVDEIEESSSSSTAPDNSIEETETKNKRKSVSFAEEKNVEIEYFENEANIKLRDHDNSIKDPSQAIKKYSKGILKRDDSMNGNSDNFKSKNDVSLQKETEDVLDVKENDEQIVSVDSSSDNEQLFDSYKSRQLSAQKEAAIAEDCQENVQNVSNKRKNQAKRSRPKPLSRKKRRATVCEDHQDDSADELENDTRVLDGEKAENESPRRLSDTEEEQEVFTESNEKPLSKRKRQAMVCEDVGGDYLSSDDSEEKLEKDVELVDVKAGNEESPGRLSDTEEQLSAERQTAITEDSHENVQNTSTKRKNLDKRSKPKPLSKKNKRATDCEDYQGGSGDHSTIDDSDDKLEKDTKVLDEEKAEDEEGPRRLSDTEEEQLSAERQTAIAEESHENVQNTSTKRKNLDKRSKPKPLSKKKKRVTDCEDHQDFGGNHLPTDDTEDKLEKDPKVLDEEADNEEGPRRLSNTEEEQDDVFIESSGKPLSKRKREDPEDISGDHLPTDDSEDKLEKDTIVLDEEKTEDDESPMRLSNTEDEQEGFIENNTNNKNAESMSEDEGELEDILESPLKKKQTDTINSDDETENDTENNKQDETKSKDTEEDQPSRTVSEADAASNSDEDESKDEDVSTVEETEMESVLKAKDISCPDSEINSTSVSENSIETPNAENDVDGSNKSNELDNSASVSHDNTPDRDDAQLVDNYVNSDDDGDHFIISQNKEKTVLAIEKEEERTKGHDTSGDNNKIGLTMDKFDDFDKNEEELGLTEVDSENINSILSHIFPPELSDDRLFDTVDNSMCGDKKLNEDETLNVSKEKKKKKVTFCDVT